MPPLLLATHRPGTWAAAAVALLAVGVAGPARLRHLARRIRVVSDSADDDSGSDVRSEELMRTAMLVFVFGLLLGLATTLTGGLLPRWLLLLTVPAGAVTLVGGATLRRRADDGAPPPHLHAWRPVLAGAGVGALVLGLVLVLAGVLSLPGALGAALAFVGLLALMASAYIRLLARPSPAPRRERP